MSLRNKLLLGGLAAGIGYQFMRRNRKNGSKRQKKNKPQND
jgi:hypothetical protein